MHFLALSKETGVTMTSCLQALHAFSNPDPDPSPGHLRDHDELLASATRIPVLAHYVAYLSEGEGEAEGKYEVETECEAVAVIVAND